MRKLGMLSVALLAVMMLTTPSQAVTFDLFESALNKDGVITSNPAALPSVGLFGSYTVTVSNSGAHYLGLYLDYEIDQEDNTWFNEFGKQLGSAPAGLSWEIDEPGFCGGDCPNSPGPGDIYTNFTAKKLDKTNPARWADDVAVALAWDFSLGADETAAITFNVSSIKPKDGEFYLEQNDPESGESIFFSTSITIRGGGNNVPEPATLLLLGSGLAGLALLRKRG